MLWLIAAWMVAAANAVAVIYIVILVYTQIKNRVRVGEIRFYYGVGPVLIPVDVGGDKVGALGTGKVSERRRGDDAYTGF